MNPIASTILWMSVQIALFSVVGFLAFDAAAAARAERRRGMLRHSVGADIAAGGDGGLPVAAVVVRRRRRNPRSVTGG